MTTENMKALEKYGKVYIRHPETFWAYRRSWIYGRYTVVAVHLKNTNRVLCAVARCSPRDQFCRKTGRDLAIVRLLRRMNLLTKADCDPTATVEMNQEMFLGNPEWYEAVINVVRVRWNRKERAAHQERSI